MPDEGELKQVSPAGPEGPSGVVVRYEEIRLRHLLPLVVRRAMAHSAMPNFDHHLVAAVKDFYGLEMDVATAEGEILEDDDERIRFFPWFLWDWRPAPEIPSVGERFLADQPHDRLETRLLQALNRSYVGVYEALEDAGPDGVRLRELATGRELLLPDEGLAGELRRSELLLARLVRVDVSADGPDPTPDEVVLIDAVYAVLPVEARGAIEAEVASLPQPGDVTGAWPQAAFEACAPELIDAAERLLEALSAPIVASGPLAGTLTSGDGPPLVLAHTTLRGETARTVRAWIGTPAGRELLQPTEDPLLHLHSLPGSADVSAFLLIVRDDNIMLCASSMQRLDGLTHELQRLSGTAMPHLKRLRELQSAAAAWSLGQGRGDAWMRALPEVARATACWLQRWISGFSDLPQRGLGDLTPRQAVRWADGRRQVTAMLDRVQALHTDPAESKLPGFGAQIQALRSQLLPE